MSNKQADATTGSKLAYSPPRVTRFGSVRNLTGGSGGTASDGGGAMTMM